MSKRLVLAAAVALALGTFVPLSVAGPEHDHGEAEGITVQGEVLDLACYIAHEAMGADHAGCAKSCVKAGQPMGLLAEDGTVYLLYAGHKDSSGFEQAKEHAGEKVVVTGKDATRGGIKAIEVNSVTVM